MAKHTIHECQHEYTNEDRLRMNKGYPLLLPMLILILPATVCRLTTNKLPDEATLSPEQEQSQAVNTPQTHILNEESGGSKGKMEIYGGGYDIPAMWRAVGRESGNVMNSRSEQNRRSRRTLLRACMSSLGKASRRFCWYTPANARLQKNRCLCSLMF